MSIQEFSLPGGSLYYELRKGAGGRTEAHVTGADSLVSELIVPQELEKCPVTVLSKKAFLSGKQLRRVELPDTLEEVGDWAFAYCSNLENVTLPGKQLRFGKAVFLECGKLKEVAVRKAAVRKAAVRETLAQTMVMQETMVQETMVRETAARTARLLAAAVTCMDASYLLDTAGAGSREWLAKWDARLLSILHSPDEEGYSKQVLCGEEDYGSTDLTAFLNNKRKEKVRLLMLRLVNSTGITEEVQRELEQYLLAHTKGCSSEETWEVLLQEYGSEQCYFELFTELGCLTEDNFDGIISDIGEEYPEMKAFFLRYKEEKIGYGDFFDNFSLDF